MKKHSELALALFNNLAYKNNIPVSLVIELLTRCNLTCQHCYLPEHINDGLSTETVKKLLVQFRELGGTIVTYTGGEIFLRKDIFELIRFARDLRLRVILLSNGTLITEDDAKMLQKLYITEFSTTIFSMDSHIHDGITGIPGSLAKTIMGIRHLSAQGINVRVKMPIMKPNAMCIRDVHRFCISNNHQFSASPTIFSKNDGDERPKKLRASGGCLQKVIKEIDEINNETANNLSNIFKYDVPCAALFSSFAIDCEGNVYPCNSLLYNIGNVYSLSLKEIWFNSKRLQDIKSIKKTDLKVCQSCKYSAFCERCPGMALLDSGDILACDTFAKEVARLRSLNSSEKGGDTN